MTNELCINNLQDVSLRLNEENTTRDLASAPEQPSPVSVLDSSAYMEGSPSPVKQTSHALTGETFFLLLTLGLVFECNS